jgi:hypothetical protein
MSSASLSCAGVQVGRKSAGLARKEAGGFRRGTFMMDAPPLPGNRPPRGCEANIVYHIHAGAEAER